MRNLPPGVHVASRSTLEIDFYYRGVRCRERLKLPPTARNLQFAANLRGRALVEIEKGIFDYAHHFPDSPRAKLYGARPAAFVTVRARLDEWYEEKTRELEHSSLLTYRRIIDNVLKPAVGDVLLRDFNRRTVRTLLASLDDSLSAKRLMNILTPLRGVAAEALRDELIDKDPLAGFKVKRRRKAVDAEEVDPFAPGEVRAILDAITEPQFANYCQFDFASGLRSSEMIGLHWPDFDLDAGTVTIRRAHVMGKMKSTKTAAGHRVVKLIPAGIAALKAQMAFTLLAGDAVFHNPRTGKAWDGDRQIREHYWRQALQAAGVRYRYPYQMRHTYASQALSAGENVLWVAKQMGHKDWTITARKYARWIPSVDPSAGSKLAALWQP